MIIIAMKYFIFTIFLAILKESHPLNPEIIKYDQFMKNFEETGRALKQEDLHKKMDASIMKRESNSSFADVERRMKNAITNLKHTIMGLTAGRASAALLDPIKVLVYGQVLKLNRLGTIAVPDARLITIEVWDESQVKTVEKAILTSGLGLNPTTDGQLVRIPIPPLTEERRQDLTKKAADYGENAKVAIRQLRREAVDTLRTRYKTEEISEDEMNNEIYDVQTCTDGYIKQIDEIIKKKCNELMRA